MYRRASGRATCSWKYTPAPSQRRPSPASRGFSVVHRRFRSLAPGVLRPERRFKAPCSPAVCRGGAAVASFAVGDDGSVAPAMAPMPSTSLLQKGGALAKNADQPELRQAGGNPYGASPPCGSCATWRPFAQGRGAHRRRIRRRRSLACSLRSTWAQTSPRSAARAASTSFAAWAPTMSSIAPRLQPNRSQVGRDLRHGRATTFSRSKSPSHAAAAS